MDNATGNSKDCCSDVELSKGRKEPQTQATHHTHVAEKDQQSLTPLFVILAYVLGSTLLVAHVKADYSAHAVMSTFMGIFFLVFSLFKLINLSGFADAYATYDLIASRSRAYALCYPFIELSLGVLYVLGLYPLQTNIVTAILMTVGSIGVYQALRTNRSIQCACLGTALKLPMTKITLVEDLAMGLMALVGIAMTLA